MEYCESDLAKYSNPPNGICNGEIYDQIQVGNEWCKRNHKVNNLEAVHFPLNLMWQAEHTPTWRHKLGLNRTLREGGHFSGHPDPNQFRSKLSSNYEDSPAKARLSKDEMSRGVELSSIEGKLATLPFSPHCTHARHIRIISCISQNIDRCIKSWKPHH